MRPAVLVVMLLGCGANHLHAVVKTATCDGTAGAPIAGAAVSVQCRDEKPLLLGVTDATGRVSYERVGRLDDKCSVLIDKEGFGSRSYDVRDVCIMQSSGACSAIGISTDLVPRKKQR